MVGGYISSYFVAIKSEATPRSYIYSFSTELKLKNRSIKFTVIYNVSGSRLNLLWTFISQSMRTALTFSLI